MYCLSRIPRNTVKKFVEKANRQLRNLATSSEVDLRGMTADEAISVLDRFLDDALLAKLPSIRVIHGKGHRRTAESGTAAPETEPQNQIRAPGRLWRGRGWRDHCRAGCLILRESMGQNHQFVKIADTNH